MSKILVVCTTDSMIWNFLIPHIRKLEHEGHSVECACSETGKFFADLISVHGLRVHKIEFERSPYSLKNAKAFRELSKLVKSNGYDVIFCHEPIGGVMGRLAGKKHGCRVIYMAHGFHFYKGAPKLNWMLYYPVEKWLARYTNALITINTEDFEFAQKNLKLRKNGKVYYVPGVGVDSKSLLETDKEIKTAKREELGVSNEDVLLISAGELNANKNNLVIIDALARCEYKNIHYVLCGSGPLDRELMTLAEKNGVADRVKLLGFRNDVKDLFAAADCFVMPSFREGLSRSLMEAMASGLPCVVSNIRGNVDLIEDGVGGCLCNPTDVDAFAAALDKLAKDGELRQRMGGCNLERIEGFDVSIVMDRMSEIFESEFKGTQDI